MNLAFTMPVTGNATVSVINQTGAIVSKKVLAINEGDNVKNFDVSNLANGVYYIRIQIGSVTQLTKILVAK